MIAQPTRNVDMEGNRFPGFGTTVETWTTDAMLVTHVGNLMRAWAARVDAACSRFRDDSDLSRANAAAGRPVAVDPVLLGAAEAAIAMADLSLGLYDPTVGGGVISAGYDRTFDSVETEGPGPVGPPRPGGVFSSVVVDREASTITIPAGYRLDLGGSAKGWAVDTALAAIQDHYISQDSAIGVCVSAGGDLAVAGRAPAGGWPVTIRERLDGGNGREALAGLRCGAIATSGATARRWGHGATAGHHIIDPRTGRPGSSRWRLVTVFSDSCLVADTAATAAWLLGDDAPDWLATLGLGARLVADDNRPVLVGDLGRWLDGPPREVAP